MEIACSQIPFQCCGSFRLGLGYQKHILLRGDILLTAQINMLNAKSENVLVEQNGKITLKDALLDCVQIVNGIKYM